MGRCKNQGMLLIKILNHQIYSYCNRFLLNLYRQRKLCGKRHNQQLHYQNNRQNIQKNIYIKFKMKINKGLLIFIFNYYFYNYNMFNNNLRTCRRILISITPSTGQTIGRIARTSCTFIKTCSAICFSVIIISICTSKLIIKHIFIHIQK